MDDFDREVRAAFHARQLPGAPESLLNTLGSLPPQPLRGPFYGLRAGLGIAAAVVVVALAALVVAGGSSRVPPIGSPGASPVTSPDASSGPSAAPSLEPSSAPTTSAEPTATNAPSHAPTPPPAGAVVTPGTNVTAAGLIDTDHGWAIAAQRLVFTGDDGATWRDVTPPAAGDDLNILGAQFLDSDQGWVAIGESFTGVADPHYGRVDVWRTSDGGASWTKAELPRAKLNNAGELLPALQFDFLDASHGFAFLGGNLAKGLNDSDLYYTSDGGRTWSADRPTGPGGVGVEGTVAFESADDGVIVGSPNGSGVYVTRDGGLTWQLGTLPAPSGATSAGRQFGRPAFFPGGIGLMAVQFQVGSTNVTKVYRSTVSGQTFGLRSPGSAWTAVLDIPLASTWDVSFLDEQHWIASDGSDTIRTSNAGSSWTQVTSHPSSLQQQNATFVDLSHGWAIDDDNQGNGYLVATSDAGDVWRRIAN
ncbi:MAG: hypothetical protein ACRDGI_09255 [Candidatus Limnocylindrales bacterium]